jgi:hypothetical protein
MGILASQIGYSVAVYVGIELNVSSHLKPPDPSKTTQLYVYETSNRPHVALVGMCHKSMKSDALLHSRVHLRDGSEPDDPPLQTGSRSASSDWLATFSLRVASVWQAVVQLAGSEQFFQERLRRQGSHSFAWHFLAFMRPPVLGGRVDWIFYV